MRRVGPGDVALGLDDLPPAALLQQVELDLAPPGSTPSTSK
jgi:hypothetical protein